VYNKLFTKILDSSIWLESTTTRLVWLTFIAMMDESGFVQLAALGNVAARARVSLAAATSAVETLEGPDPASSDQEFDGRRIERVPGGWLVLNARKYRAMVTRVIIQEQTRERVRKHRAKRTGNAPVTPSDTDTDTESDPDSEAEKPVDQVQRASARSSHKVLVKLAHEVLEADDSHTLPLSELVARLKDLAGARGIPYDGRSSTKAMESACAQMDL
jgi:predicted DNA binding CopG/RHH family protein